MQALRIGHVASEAATRVWIDAQSNSSSTTSRAMQLAGGAVLRRGLSAQSFMDRTSLDFIIV